MQTLQQIREQLRRVWLGMSLGGRVSFVVLTAICAAAIIGVGYWAAQPDYRVLFSELSAEDSGAITAKLQSQGIPFRLAVNGTTVLVPAAQMQQARVDLAVAGLPAGGAKGFEMLDGSPLTMTPFLQHVNYSRAMQAELAKTIMGIEPIAFARVHIVRPEPTPFVRDQKPTTASVVVKLKPGATLARHVAAGIVALVAGSVEGLTPDNVTVLDTSGRVLSEPRGSEIGAVASSNFEYRREVETYLATKAEEMLAQSLGPSRAIVRVTADINFKRVKEKREDIDPESRVVTREKSMNRKTTSPTAAVRGPAGTASNLAKQPAESSSSSSGSTEEESENSYDYSKTIQDLEQEVGNVERLTIAALVDLSGSSSDAAAEATAPMTVEQAEEVIKRAVGFKQGRDEIKVTDVKLPGAVPLAGVDAEWLATRRWENYIQIARHASLAIAALAALLLGRMVLKRLAPAPPQPDAGAAAPTRPAVLEQLSAEARNNPGGVARILEQWIEEAEVRRKAAA
jgi:flagellar M-ring protein FliF